MLILFRIIKLNGVGVLNVPILRIVINFIILNKCVIRYK